MTTYTAVLIACLTVLPAPADCQKHEMRFEGPVNPAFAVLQAQAMTAEWLEKHPGLKPVKLTIRSGLGA